MVSPSDFWSGEFGRAYHDRNKVTIGEFTARVRFWKKVAHYFHDLPEKILEIGAGNGANILALDDVYKWLKTQGQTTVVPELNMTDINKEVVDKATLDLPVKNANWCSITDLSIFPDDEFDLVFTYGVLIHVPPIDLDIAVDEMIRVSKKYVMCAEYFAPKCEQIEYRGMDKLLWRNNFGEFFLDKGLKLRGYGFCWKEDTKLDNVTWWVFEK